MVETLHLGLDFGASKCRVVALQGKSLQPAWSETFAVSCGLAGAQKTMQKFDKLLAAKPTNMIASMCASIAAQVDARTGVVLGSPNLGWSGFALADHLSEITGVKVTVENDVRAATWGEYIAGTGKGHPNIAAVFIGSGIGGGIIVNGELLHGAGNTAGEVGHLPLALGSSCGCGGMDCVEGAASSAHLERRATIAMQNGRTPELALITSGKARYVRIDRVVIAAEAGDRLLREMLDEALELWTRLCLCLAMIMAPELIILGGGLFNGWEEAFPQIVEKFDARKLPACQTKLVRAALGDLAGAIGAADLGRRATSSMKSC
jgi:glucokinase